MLDFIDSFKSLVKLENIQTDNNIFKLHYKFTVTILIIFSILVTSKQHFGEPIDCDVESEHKDVINTYCWMYGTYTIKRTLTDDTLPGLGNYHVYMYKYKATARGTATISPWEETLTANPEELIASHKYYQWVSIVLCFQALLFYIPHYLWKIWERDIIRMLSEDLGGPLISQSWNRDYRDKLIVYILSGRCPHNIYFLRYAFCEILNFMNVVCQILLLNWFVGNDFSQFGIDLIAYNEVNPLTRVFPKLAKCTYYKYGPSGTLISRDALCVLPLNVINEKLFVFLWFWFYLLLILSAFVLIYRAIFMFVPRFRVYLLMAQAHYLPKYQADAIVKRLTVGDYFVLYLLGKNLNPLVYKDLVGGIAKTIMGKYSISYDSNLALSV